MMAAAQALTNATHGVNYTHAYGNCQHAHRQLRRCEMAVIYRADTLQNQPPLQRITLKFC